jgi:crotonobetainyl-CoA:carnitine CoA-transferase CaiB-like acyl-CoA transferase
MAGKGDYLDVAMTDCMLAWMGARINEHQGRNRPPKDKFVGRGAYGAFEAKDGKYLVIACVENHYWQKLCHLLGLTEMAGKKEYAEWVDRIERAKEINPVLNECFRKKNRDEWLDLLRKEDIPCGPVNFIEDLAADPQVKHRQTINFAGNYPVVNYPVKFDRVKLKEPVPAPRLGGHNKEILAWLGYQREEIENLRQSGVIMG